jgi:hypothetical protein
MKNFFFSFLLLCCGTISNAQNVGIGTTTPLKKLHIAGEGYNNAIIISDSSGAMTVLNGGYISGATFTPYVGALSNHPFWIVSGGYIRMHFSNGPATKIGINTVNPYTLFTNTDKDIAGSDSQGVGNYYALAWRSPSIGYTTAFYNSSGFPGSNGLAVKINSTASTSRILDLSTGNFQDTAGTPVMVVNGNGKVGIGIGSPATRLSNTNRGIRGSNGVGILSDALSWVIHDVGYTQAIYNDNPNGNANGLAVKIAGNSSNNRILELSTGNFQDTAGTAAMVVNGDGKVGIGISNPFSKLHINGGGTDAQLSIQDTLGTFVKLSAAYFPTVNYVPFVGTYSNHPFGIISNNAVRIYLAGNGNVGIRNGNPVCALTNTDSNIIASDNFGISMPSFSWSMNDKGYVQALYNSSLLEGASGLAVKIAGNGSNYRLLDLSVGASPTTAGTPVMVVQGDGTVGIGNQSPQHRLSVGAATTDGQLVAVRSYGGGTSWHGGAAFGYTTASVILGQLNGVATIGGHNANLTAWANLALNPGGGNVGIATNTPTEKLTINGALKIADGGYTGLINNDTIPAPTGGAGTIVFSNSHFFGWNGTQWKQLDN